MALKTNSDLLRLILSRQRVSSHKDSTSWAGIRNPMVLDQKPRHQRHHKSSPCLKLLHPVPIATVQIRRHGSQTTALLKTRSQLNGEMFRNKRLSESVVRIINDVDYKMIRQTSRSEIKTARLNSSRSKTAQACSSDLQSKPSHRSQQKLEPLPQNQSNTHVNYHAFNYLSKIKDIPNLLEGALRKKLEY